MGDDGASGGVPLVGGDDNALGWGKWKQATPEDNKQYSTKKSVKMRDKNINGV